MMFIIIMLEINIMFQNINCILILFNKIFIIIALGLLEFQKKLLHMHSNIFTK